MLLRVFLVSLLFALAPAEASDFAVKSADANKNRLSAAACTDDSPRKDRCVKRFKAQLSQAVENRELERKTDVANDETRTSEDAMRLSNSSKGREKEIFELLKALNQAQLEGGK